MLISAMNITDTLLPHGVAQVSFQSAQRTEWSFSGADTGGVDRVDIHPPIFQ